MLATIFSGERHPIIRILSATPPHPSGDDPLSKTIALIARDRVVFGESDLKAISERIDSGQFADLATEFSIAPIIEYHPLSEMLGSASLSKPKTLEKAAFCVLWASMSYVLTFTDPNDVARGKSLIEDLEAVAGSKFKDLVADTILLIVALVRTYLDDLVGVMNSFFGVFPGNVNGFFLCLAILQEYVNNEKPLESMAADILLVVLEPLVKENEMFRSGGLFNRMIGTITHRIAAMDPIAISFLIHIGPYLSDDDADQIFGMFPGGLVDGLVTGPPCVAVPDLSGFEDAVKLVFREDGGNPLKKCTEVETFGNHFDIPDNDFQYHDNVKDILTKRKLLVGVDMMTRFAKQRGSSSLAILKSAFLSLTDEFAHSEYLYDLFLVFTYAFRSLGKDTSLDQEFGIVFESSLFNPRVTIFGQKRDLQSLFLARGQILMCLLQVSDQILPGLLASKKEYPLMTAEFLCFLSQHVKHMSQTAVTAKFLDYLRSIALNYQVLNIHDLEHRKEIEIARRELMCLLSKLLTQQDIAHVCQVSPKVTSVVISHLYELSMRKFVFNCIIACYTDLSEVAPHLFSLCQDACSCISKPEYRLLLSDVLTLVNTLSQMEDNFGCFAGMQGSFINAIRQITPGTAAVDVLCGIIGYLSVMAKVNTPQPDTMEAIAWAINTVAGGDPPAKIYDAMMGFLAGATEPYEKPVFVILQSVWPFLSDIVKVFINSAKLISLLQYLQGLCSYSKTNAYACHVAYLDMFLLKEVEARKMDCENESFITEAMGLVKRIAMQCSSLPVLVNFISLFCPSKERRLGRFHSLFLDTMADIISAKKAYPVAHVPLGAGKPYITAKDLKLSNHMSMVFWISVSNPTEPIVVFAMTDALARYVKIGITAREVFVAMNGETQKAPITCVKDEYFPLCIYYDKGESQCDVVVAVWNVEPVYFTFTSDFDKNIALMLAGRTKSSTLCGGLGPFAIYDEMDPTEVTCVIGRGVRRRGLDKALLSVIPAIENSLLTINVQGSAVKPSSDVKLEGLPTVQHMSLAEILALCKVEVLLPLYAELDLEVVGESNSLPAVQITELFRAILSVGGDSGQLAFHNSGGTTIMAYLLLSSNSRHLTSSLYRKLVEVVYILTDTELINDWVDDLILNFELLAHAHPDEQVSIVERVLTGFVDSQGSLCNDVKPFSAMLSTMQKNLPCNGTEQRARVRAKIIEFCLSMTQIQFNAEDARFLICTLIDLARGPESKSRDIQEMLELLFLLMTECHQMEMFHTPHLLYMVLCGNESVSFQVLEFLKRMDDAKPKSVSHLFCLIPSLLQFEPSDKFFKDLTLLISGFPSFARIGFYLSFKNGGRGAEALKSVANGKAEFLTSIWPLCLGWSLVDKQIGQEILRMVARHELTNGNGFDLLATILMIHELTSVDYHEVGTICLLEMIDAMGSSNNNDTELRRNVANVCILFMFFKPNDYINNVALQSLYQSSPVADEQECANHPTQVLDGLYSDCINNPSLASIKMKFSICLDEQGKWRDQKLGCHVMQLMTSESDAGTKAALTLLSYCQNRTAGVTSRDIIESVLHHFGPLCDSLCEAVVAQAAKRASLASQIKVDVSALTRQVQEDELGIYMENQFLYNKESDGEKRWRHLFVRLAQNHGPWQRLLAHTDVHMMRDETICYAYSPMKQKVNDNFQQENYDYASLCRDVGSVETAQAIMEKRKVTQQQELARKYSQDIPVLQEVTIKSDEEKDEKDNLEMTTIKSRVRLGPIDAERIKDGERRACKFIVYRESLELSFDAQPQTRRAKEKPSKKVILPVGTVTHLLRRYIIHRPRGIEIITDAGKSYLISFIAHDSRNVLHEIKSLPTWQSVEIQTVDNHEYFKRSNYTERWTKGQISTFEYLSALNFYSSRSFHDPAMYPVFPWVLRDYTSETLNLNNPESFRDLQLPMGFQDTTRLKDLIKKRDDLENISDETYLYSCGFSSPLTVYLFLMRVEPFTRLHIDAQGGRFDHASRLFTSIGKAFKMACTQVNDFRELIPEFFFDPAFLVNANHYNLGSTPSGEAADVELPPWASTPMEFIYKHRKALESRYVSEHIHAWIDYMFGVRQHDLSNDYHGKMYESAWEKYKTDNPFVRAEIEAIMQNCGQIPKQMFFTEHPRRAPEPSAPSSFPVIDLKLDQTFVLAGFAAMSDRTLSVYGITEKGIVYLVTCALSPQPHLENEVVCEVNTAIPTIAVCESGKVLIATRLGVVYLLESKGQRRISSNFWHTGRVNCIAVDGFLAATGGNDTTTNILNVDAKQILLSEIPSFTDAVVCVAVSQAFRVCVSGTRNGTIFVRSTTSMSTVRTINLGNNVPELVLITPAWGFIIVYSTRNEAGRAHMYLSLYTINGEEIIGLKEISCQIACWTSFVSRDGFDFVIFGDKAGKLYMFEAFYMDIGAPFHDCWSKVLDIKYVDSEKIITTLTKDILWVIPFPECDHINV